MSISISDRVIAAPFNADQLASMRACFAAGWVDTLCDSPRNYEGVVQSDAIKECFAEAICTLENLLEHPALGAARARYHRPDLSDRAAVAILPVIQDSVPALKGWDAGQLTEVERAIVLKPLKTLVKKCCNAISLVCRAPSPVLNPEFGEAGRALQMLQVYWRVVLQLVGLVEGVPIWSSPYPVAALVVNLKDRVRLCTDILGEHAGSVAAEMQSLLGMLATGDAEGFAACKEFTREIVNSIENQLQPVAMQLSPHAYEQTAEEEIFLQWASQQIEGFRKISCSAFSALQDRYKQIVRSSPEQPAHHTGVSGRKPRMKAKAAEPFIMRRLLTHPHDTAVEVAKHVGCSTGLVAESNAWRLNRERLSIAEREGIDPRAVKLTVAAITEAGGSSRRQAHASKVTADDLDESLDRQDDELMRLIGERRKAHPKESLQAAASAVGCEPADVKRYDEALKRLMAEQEASAAEDSVIPGPDGVRPRQKWIPRTL